MREHKRDLNGYGHVLFLAIQVLGLLALHWNGLYVIYLCWFDLFCLAVYTYIRNQQYKREEAWTLFQTSHSHLFKEEPSMVIFIRVLSLAFYLFAIGISAIPYEYSFQLDEENHPVQKYYEIRNMDQFFEGLLIGDPLFILAIFFSIFYYSKLLMAKPDLSERGMIEFSFCRSYKDPRYFAPFLALITFMVPLMFLYPFRNKDDEAVSYLFSFAIWLLIFQFVADWILGKWIKQNNAV